MLMSEMLIGPRRARHPRLTKVRSAVLRRLFRALYGPGARFYDRFTRFAFAGEWQRWQAAAIPFLPAGGVVVEFGSGTGAFAHAAAAESQAWIALDISHQMIAVARRHHRPPAPAFIRASAAAVPLRSGFADAIVMTFPSDFFLSARAADEMRRILKQDGLLVVVLSGDLYAIGIRRTCTRAVLVVAQGAPGRDTPWVPAIAGFEGRSVWQPTEYGRALVYVGRRL
jgi:SAM-dependent methyltransferase